MGQDESWLPKQSTLMQLEKAFEDARGTIQPLVDGNFASSQWISSRAGAVRANHYHKDDWHFAYMVSGAMDYYYRPAGSKEQPTCVRVSAGQMVFTPPMEEHAMRFLQDSAFVNFAGRPRDQASYEEDLVRVQLIEVPELD
ncbi:MAG: hypothetical protein GKR94_18755 [Gammaproteobacteria bacterium]|nr:hypothetical protein [Gammaproteobacteria bacterium]